MCSEKTTGEFCHDQNWLSKSGFRSAVSGHAFELLVGAWLSDVIRSEKTTGEFCHDQNWLSKSGFRSAVKGGHIEYEAVV